MKQYDVTALGELLIDFTENGVSEQGNPVLEANPGGAPCNVLAMLKKLGRRCAFIGKVGNDSFGTYLTDTVKACGIETSGMTFDPEVHTTLAFVHTLEGGEREFSFYRHPGADMMLKRTDLRYELLSQTRVFHFGSLSLTHPDPREATRYAVETAKNAGALISFDPNLREPLWDSLEIAREQIEYGLSVCDILKISDNELEFTAGTNDYDKGVAYLREKYDIPLIFLTLGKDGSRAYFKDIRVEEAASDKIKPIEKTGAGDTFCGCALSLVLDHGLDRLNEQTLSDILRFANAGASIITARNGALNVMPGREEISSLCGSDIS